MKKTLFALLTIITALISSGAARTEITTVILSNDTATSFTVSTDDSPTKKGTLEFSIGPALPDGAKVKECTLRVVPTQQPQPNAPRAGQDVTVLLSAKQVGQWSAYSQPTEPYAAELKPEACAPGSNVFTLKTDSKYTKWDYHGGGAGSTADRPRLIVTYDSPNPLRSGQSTDWAYEKPVSFFSSPLLELSGGQKRLTNPVSYDGAVYVVVGSSDTRGLYRLAGSEKNTYRSLDFEVDDGAFAFVTAWGRLQLITNNAIHSCDLTTLGSADKLICKPTTSVKITVDSNEETPAIGPDGSLYFRDKQAQGSIFAYNPSLREIWSTELKLKEATIALSADGRYAYVLAKIPIKQENAEIMIALLRIDTATGETVLKEIENPEGVKPLLQELLRPAVVRKVINKRNVDYVFLAGNTSDTGILQLVAFDQNAQPKVVWSRTGKKITAAPMLSVKDGNALFVVQNGMLKRYLWYNTKEGSTGAYSDSDMKEERLKEKMADVTSLLVDRGDSLYICADKSIYAYQSASKTMSPAYKLGFNPKLLFMQDGSLIGCDDSRVYDFSPKALAEESWPKTLVTESIYSADNITVSADAGKAIKNGERVILKGSSIKIPNGFRWPLGATLKLQSVQKSEQQTR
jgi:hypothetical protein